MHEYEKQVPIWFFIGALLTVYGVIIFAAGICGWLRPPLPEHMVKLWNYHADVWWGALLTVFGSIYVVKFWPTKPATITGQSAEANLGTPSLRR